MDFWTETGNQGSHGVLLTLHADTDVYLPTGPSEFQKSQVKRQGRKKEKKKKEKRKLSNQKHSLR